MIDAIAKWDVELSATSFGGVEAAKSSKRARNVPACKAR